MAILFISLHFVKLLQVLICQLSGEKTQLIPWTHVFGIREVIIEMNVQLHYYKSFVVFLYCKRIGILTW